MHIKKQTFVIAEAGVNHNGDVGIAKQLISVAVDAGADAVKFQTFKAENLVTKNASKADYQKRNTDSHESQFDMLKRLELSEGFHKELVAYCKQQEIEFLSTPFDNESVEVLDELGVRCFKIPSGEITNKPLIRNVSEKGKPIILSTGMSYLGEVERAVRWIEETWNKLNGKPKLTLLHCVSNYPSNVEDCNLMAMKTMETAFGYPVGFSDHTLGIEVSTAAVALGATVIEKHFTIDRNMVGPDHKASLEPDELKAMIVSIRNVEKAIGDGCKVPMMCEENVRNIARKSLVAKRNIKRGDVFAIDNIAIKRPGSGISPIEIENVIGRKADRDFFVDELIII